MLRTDASDVFAIVMEHRIALRQKGGEGWMKAVKRGVRTVSGTQPMKQRRDAVPIQETCGGVER